MGVTTIRGLDKSILDRLDDMAVSHGISREEFLRRQLRSIALMGEVKEAEDKYASLVNTLSDQAQMMSDIIEHNNYILERVEKKL